MNRYVIDVETTGLDYFKDTILDLAICDVDTEESWFGSLEELSIPRNAQLVFHNARFDLRMLQRAGLDLRKFAWRDTMLMHHLYDENAGHGLGEIVMNEYNDHYKAEFWSKYKKYEDAPMAEREAYNIKDVVYTAKLYKKLEQELNPALVAQVHDFARELLDTEIEGVPVDMAYLFKLGETLGVRIAELKTALLESCKYEVEGIEIEAWKKELEKRKTARGKANVKKPVFNWDSHQQLQGLLYGSLGLPVVRNRGRKPTLDDAALEQLSGSHPAVDALREYRGHQKIKGSFVDGTLERVKGTNIHPEFNINGTVTGRISSSNPNLQQLPRSGGIRRIYVPRAGSHFISADYGQLEICLSAHFSEDPTLLDIVRSGQSMHTATAERLGIERQQAKTLNFAILYGASANKIRKVFECSNEEAEDIIRRFFEAYPGLQQIISKCHAAVEQGRSIHNPFGRQRHFADPSTYADKWALERAKRQAFNSLIQGTGADLTNRAFTKVSRTLKAQGIGRGLFPIHDELLVEVKTEHAEQTHQLMIDTMIGEGKFLLVPLSVDCSEAMTAWLD